MSGALKVSISLFPILLAAVLFGPLGAMAVSVCLNAWRGANSAYTGGFYTHRVVP